MEINPRLTEKGLRDYNLVKQAVESGDQKAYAELMKHYYDSLFFMMLKMTNNKQDADDLTIEAFTKAFKYLHQYTPDYAFSTWLFKIASNNCVDFIRRKNKRTFSSEELITEKNSEDLTHTLPSQTLDPEEKIIKMQKIKMMRDVVDKLKPHYRNLIEMRYFEELSYEEISKKLDLPIGTIKAQLFRAREFLSNILKNTEGKY